MLMTLMKIMTMMMMMINMTITMMKTMIKISLVLTSVPQWYTGANMALAESQVQEAWFPKMVQRSNCELRDSTHLLMSKARDQKVPFVILSAGVGDLIKEILSHFEVLHDNVRIVSNFLDFDSSSGAVRGLKPPCIHMFNKKASSQEGLEERKNVILIGDSLGDLRMADGIKDLNVVLSIGFLNKNVEGNLAKYKESFDIVLVDDQTMDFPLALLEDISRAVEGEGEL